MSNPFRYFNSSPEVIRLVVMMYVRYPLSLRNVEDLLTERGIDISHETVRFWWNRFGPMFAAEIRKRRIAHVRALIGFWCKSAFYSGIIRARSNSIPARPYMARLRVFSLLICPSVCPLLHGSDTAFRTASRSWRIVFAKRCIA